MTGLPTPPGSAAAWQGAAAAPRRRRVAALSIVAAGALACELLAGAPVAAEVPVAAGRWPVPPAVTASRQGGRAVADRERALWRPPLGLPFEVSGPYRAPPSPYASGHRGIDLPAVPGMRVIAPVAGEVTFVGKVVDRHVLSVSVDARTVVSLEPITQPDAALAVGDSVAAGQTIGEVGTGGHCLAECIHVGVRVDGAYVNPLRYFLAKPVLLPW